MEIRLKCKLKAYTRGIHTKYAEEAPIDGSVYGRKDAKWEKIDDIVTRTELELAENSGLNLEHDELNHKYILGIRKEELNELPQELEPDTTYYIVDLEPNNYLDGGTAFSDGNNEYVIMSQFGEPTDGGESNSVANIEMCPINAEGVYNG